MTQNQTIHKALLKGPVTTLDAFRKFGVTRLSGRIFELRQRGINIISKPKRVRTRHGETTVAEYRLKRGAK